MLLRHLNTQNQTNYIVVLEFTSRCMAKKKTLIGAYSHDTPDLERICMNCVKLSLM